MRLSLHLTGCALRGGSDGLGLVVPVCGVVPVLHGDAGLGLGLLDVREGLGHVVDLVVDENSEKSPIDLPDQERRAPRPEIVF